MRDATADRIAETAVGCDVDLTAHGPYYVNLCGAPEVVEASVRRLETTARLGTRCGARSFCFHAGFYQQLTAGEAGRRVRRNLRRVAATARREKLAIDVRPELTGRPSQAGSLDEILDWSVAVPGIAPCVDFSHHYARHAGVWNRYEDFAAVLERVRVRLGGAALGRLHVHVTGIEYGPHGERRHVSLRRSPFRYRELLRALKDMNVSGWVISESPAQEDDALLLQRTYRRLRRT